MIKISKENLKKIIYEECIRLVKEDDSSSNSQLVQVRSKIEARSRLSPSIIWFIIAEAPPTQEDAKVLGLPIVSIQTFREQGGIIDASDPNIATTVNRIRDGLHGLTAVVWVTDPETILKNMPDAYSHRSGATKI